jgi:hypothetical protein
MNSYVIALWSVIMMRITLKNGNFDVRSVLLKALSKGKAAETCTNNKNAGPSSGRSNRST